MDKYKLEQFNNYRVGTKEENCGMLFVFALNSRQYGFEIGDGFKEGTLLRQDLEKDFITSDMKNLLIEKDYDAVVLQITKHLEQIMADEENGIYTQKQAQAEAEAEEFNNMLNKGAESMDKAIGFMLIGIIVLISGASILGVAYLSISHLYKRSNIKKLLVENQKYIQYMQSDEATLFKYLLNKGYSTSSLKSSFIEYLHEYYIESKENELSSKELKYGYDEYKKHLNNSNDITSFKELRLKHIDTIIHEVDNEQDRIREITEQNQKKIVEYVDRNKYKITNPDIPAYALEGAMTARMHKSGVDKILIDESWLESAFVVELNELNFKSTYDKFIAENADKINKEYFNSSDFYNSLRKTNEYKNYNYDHHDNLWWAMPLLLSHMSCRRQEIEEAERLAAERYRRDNESTSSSNSFGGSFGGGFSSGGGFSGGW
jgi:uncharacterized membrane protein YgcG